MFFSKYLNEEGPILNRSNTTKLILIRRYQSERGCGIHIPGKTLTPLAIRQSVIANLLKVGKDSSAVQVFAGHKSPLTTERYQQTGIE